MNPLSAVVLIALSGPVRGSRQVREARIEPPVPLFACQNENLLSEVSGLSRSAHQGRYPSIALPHRVVEKLDVEIHLSLADRPGFPILRVQGPFHFPSAAGNRPADRQPFIPFRSFHGATPFDRIFCFPAAPIRVTGSRKLRPFTFSFLFRLKDTCMVEPVQSGGV